MKKQIVTSLIALGFACTAFAQTQVPSPSTFAPDTSTPERTGTFYLEPSVIFVPTNKGLKNAFGGSLSGGAIIYEQHMLGLNLSYFKADYKKSKGPGKMTFMPLTATYQYVLPLGSGFEIRPGVFAGAMFEKSKDHPGISNKSRTAFTGGPSLGFDYVVSQSVSVGVSGKWMYVNKVKDLRKRNLAVIGINCNVRF